MLVTIKGKFLSTNDYFKKDENGNLTNQKVNVITLFDGTGSVQINGVDGSALKFGDEISLDCDIYAYKDRPGYWLRVHQNN